MLMIISGKIWQYTLLEFNKCKLDYENGETFIVRDNTNTTSVAIKPRKSYKES